MKLLLFSLLTILLFWNCTSNSETEKYQNKRDDVISVQERIKEIEFEDVYMGAITRLYLMDDCLIIGDHSSFDKQIHIFGKYNYDYMASTAYRGGGPSEVTVMGNIATNETRRVFYVSDHGKQVIFSYHLDSVLLNPLYEPGIKMRMDKMEFPDKYQYISDTLCVGLVITPIGVNDFKPTVSKWNMNTGKITPMKYEHPEVEKKRITCAVSMENGIYVECHSRCNLMTICDLNGELKYNIYGRNWNERRKIEHYGKVAFCGNYILTLYSGDDPFIEDNNKGIKSNLPTKFIVFTTSGDYIKTLEAGYRISDFCYDKDNHRLIMSLDDEIQFAYLELDGLI